MNPNSIKNFQWDNPELAEKRRASIKATWQRTPEQLERHKSGVKSSWTPERKARQAAIMRDVHFIAKLRSEGFAQDEINNLMTIGKASK